MSQTNQERNTFVQGLITESSALTFPENASVDERNFVLNRNGSRSRRLGLAPEANAQNREPGLTYASANRTSVATYLWENVDNNPDVSFCVVKHSNYLEFYDAFATPTTYVTRYEIGTTSDDVQFTTINGRLVVVLSDFEIPIVLSYKDEAVGAYFVDIRVRDIWGITGGKDRQTGLTIEKAYNLVNQGWPDYTMLIDPDTPVGPTGKGPADFPDYEYPHLIFANYWGFFPGQSDIWSLGKTEDNKFNPESVVISDVGSINAPIGRTIFPLFGRGRGRVRMMDNLPGGFTAASSSGIKDDFESYGISNVASFAGRVFYAVGDKQEERELEENAPNTGSMILFTQVVNELDDFQKCYQTNDPTSSEFSDILATDGGTIVINNMRRALKMIERGNSVVVFAENGIWAISGRDGVFTASDFTVDKISTVGVINKNSIIETDSGIFFWSEAGIYVLGNNEQGQYQVQNITERTIQTLYCNINAAAKLNVVANYEAERNIVSWLYNDTDSYDGINYRYKYNCELVLDITLGAFYVNKFDETQGSYVAGYVETGIFSIVNTTQAIVDGDDVVQDQGDDVVLVQTNRSRGTRSTKYLTVLPETSLTYTFSTYNNEQFLDWNSVDAAAYLITGYELFQDSARNKQVNYLTMHFNMTEKNLVASGEDLVPDNPSSCMVQSQWNWANSGAGGKFGRLFQTYKLPRTMMVSGAGPLDYGQSVISTKNKIRGVGKTFSMRIETEPGKDLQLLGWSLSVDGRRHV